MKRIKEKKDMRGEGKEERKRKRKGEGQRGMEGRREEMSCLRNSLPCLFTNGRNDHEPMVSIHVVTPYGHPVVFSKSESKVAGSDMVTDFFHR